jgi:hypothetical protein
MKTRGKIPPDADLAAWCAALASPIIEDAVPTGYFTTKQLSAKLGKPRPTMARLLHEAVAAGKCEVQNFRVNVGAFARSTPHYRLK